MELERKKYYFDRIARILEKHGLVDEELHWDDVNNPLVRGVRALIQAAHEPAIAWRTDMERAFREALEAAEMDRHIAEQIHRFAKRYGRMLPRGIPSETKVAQIAEIPLPRITPNSEISRIPRDGDTLKKYLMVRDVEALTRRITSPRNRRRP